MYPIYIIGDEKREPQRIEYLNKYFNDLNISPIYFQPTWKDTLSDDERSKFTQETHGRKFKDSEKSLFLNFLYLIEKCLQEKHDYVIIFESDVIFDGNLKEYMNKIFSFLEEFKPHCTSIGSGCDLIDNDVNTEDMTLQYAKKKIVRCMDSQIFSYEGLILFKNYIDNYGVIDEPIDNFLQKYIELSDYTYYWLWPSITLQGSQYGYYNSSIQYLPPQESEK
jgi:GR25 family glycosyltransferase involved in LPS biosynthesis